MQFLCLFYMTITNPSKNNFLPAIVAIMQTNIVSREFDVLKETQKEQKISFRMKYKGTMSTVKGSVVDVAIECSNCFFYDVTKKTFERVIVENNHSRK